MKLNKSRIKSIVDSRARRSQSEIDKFKSEAEKSLGYALNWYGESVLEEINVLSILRPFTNLIAEEDYTVDDLIRISEKVKKDGMYFFKNGGFKANSTSAMSNLNNVALGKAYGKLFEMIEYMEEELSQEEKIEEFNAKTKKVK